MTQHPHDTTLEVDPHVPLTRLIRIFDAPVSKVFRAHVDPELFSQWNGPRDTEMHVDHFDCRTGGSYRYEIRRTDFVAGFHGSFHEVREDEVIVQTFTFEGVPDGVSLERLTFEAIGPNQTRLVASSLVDSFEDRDAFLATGMESGVREGYERLDELLSAQMARS
jgi:uncharacterized protein YndB with AHSA1/START domain